MALGPKAMGEAILANLESKTGKKLAHWQAELRRSGLNEQAAACKHLQGLGLGKFQAMAVVETSFGASRYADEGRLVDDQFARYPEQRVLYDLAVAGLDGDGFTPKPCRSYLPVYRDGRIAASFKPTSRGLYAALVLQHPEDWPDRVAHKPSLGGSSRLSDGVYLSDAASVRRLLKALRLPRSGAQRQA